MKGDIFISLSVLTRITQALTPVVPFIIVFDIQLKTVYDPNVLQGYPLQMCPPAQLNV